MAWQTAPLHRRELQAGQCGVWTVDRKRLSVVVRRSDVKSRTGSHPIRSLFETASAVPRAGLRQSRGMHPNVRVCLPPEPTFRPGSTPPRHVALARNVGLGRIGRIATLTEPCRMRALAARAGANARKTAATDGSRRPIWLRLPTLATRLLVRWCGSYGPPCPIVNRSEALLVIRISRLAVSNGSNHQTRTIRKESPMCGLRLPRSRSAHRPSRPYRYVVSLLAALALLAVPAVASAAKDFTEQVASAR